MINGVLLALYLLALVLVLRSGLGPHTVQSKPQTLGTLGPRFTATLLSLTARETAHPGSFRDTARSRTGFGLIAQRTRRF